MRVNLDSGAQPVDVLPGREDVWAARLARARKPLTEARRRGLVPTPYFVEAWDYYRRAKLLQEMNLGQRRRAPVGDRLMEEIPIYDTVRRRYAGFSNALEQLWYGDAAPKIKANRARGFDLPKFNGSALEWAYLCLVHRITGSGASFEHDHGWRNTVLPLLANLPARQRASFLLSYNVKPIFTSLGNQIPPFNKRTHPTARNAGHEYLGLVAPILVELTYHWLTDMIKMALGTPVPITEVVNQVLKFQRQLGWKQFKFVLTAWVMDLAEYLPHLVDPTSDCYHGKNAIESMTVCFDRRRSQPRGQAFLDAGTRLFADLTGTHPMDVEDASPGCDLIRWLENYVPKRGFDHVLAQGIYNSSSLVYHKGRQP